MPLFYLCAAFLLGVLSGAAFAWPAADWLAIALGCLALAGLAWFRARRAERVFAPRLLRALALLRLDPAAVSPALIRTLPFLLGAAFAVGAARWAAAQAVLDAPGFIARYNDDGTRYTVIGRISAPPDERDTFTYLRVETEEIRPANGIRHLPVKGLLLARVEPGGDWNYGDRVALTGSLQTPWEEEGFSYRDYLARQGVYATMPYADVARLALGRPGQDRSAQGRSIPAAVFALRNRAHAALRELFPDPEASLLSGILLGLDRGLAPDLVDAFRDTGASHIIAISGFNISIIAAIFTNLFGRLFGPRWGTAVAIAGIGLYTLLVGGDPAVVRAALMGCLAISLRRLGRASAGLNSLMLAAAAMAFLNPLILSDAGFQLSFAATLGLVLYTEPLTQAFAAFASRYLRISTVRRILPWVSDAVLLTLAAQIATLPVILYHFGRVSLTSFLVNPLILPVQPAVMVLGGLTMLGGLAWLPAGRVLALLAYPFAAYSVRMVELFAGIRGVLAVGGVGSGVVLTVAAGPLLVKLASQAGEKFRKILPLGRVILLLILLGAAVNVWRTALAASPGLLRFWLLDVGMGEAVLVQTPADRWLLVGGGPSAVRLSDQLGRRIPFSQRAPDWLVVAGTGDEQLGALPRVLEQYRPGSVLWAGTQNISPEINNLQEMMNKLGLEIAQAQTGQALDLGDGATLEVLSVTRRGAVLLLSWKDFRALLPIGADFETLALDLPPVSLLLLAESGYAPLNPPEWIAGLQPELVLLSVEAGNREGLPDADLLNFLESYNLLRTDENGWIGVSTDGMQLWLEVERK